MLNHVAAGDDRLGQQREIAAKLGENSAELRDEEAHQKDHDADGETGENDRINHGGFELALEVLLAGAEVGDLAEDGIEKPPCFAGADHRDVYGGKVLGPFGEGFGERCAADYFVVNLTPQLLRSGIGSFAAEQSEGPGKGNAAGEEIGEFSREGLDAFGGDFAGSFAIGGGLGFFCGGEVFGFFD